MEGRVVGKVRCGDGCRGMQNTGGGVGQGCAIIIWVRKKYGVGKL